MAWMPVVLLFALSPVNVASAAPDRPQGCERTYTRSTAHKLFRAVYRNPTRVSRHERRTIRRVVRCQRHGAGKATKRGSIRWHHARYRRHHRLAPPGNRGIAYVMLWRRGQLAQWPCLNRLWTGENRAWNHRQPNLAGSGAYGIPQALPASKMATAGADWRTNPATQIRWGLGYIAGRYGTPCGALGAWLSRSPHWY